jgi:HNH endonuclease
VPPDTSKYYSSGKPCRNGHTSLRRASDAVCVACECDRLSRWKAKNMERVRERGRRQRAKDPQKCRDQERARYAENPAAFIDKQKKFYVANGDKIRARRRAYHHLSYVDPEVRERAQERTRQWAIDNPEQAKVNRRNGKARRRHVPGTHTADDIAEILKAQKGRCAYCRNKLGAYEVDHIKPVAKGGTNDRRNIQLTCGKCNRTKSARDPEVHARTLGMLL